MLAVIWGGVTLAVSVLSLIMDFSVQQLCSCIIPLLYFISVSYTHLDVYKRQ